MLREYVPPSLFRIGTRIFVNPGLIDLDESKTGKMFNNAFGDISMLEPSRTPVKFAPSSLILDQMRRETKVSLVGTEPMEVLEGDVLENEVSEPKVPHETFIRLTPDRLDQIMALQEITFAKLKEEGTEKFLYRKSREEYEALLTDRDSFVVGYFEDGHLVGQLVVKKLDAEEEEAGKDYHISLGKKTLLGIAGGVERFSIGGMIVHPEHRGKGLAQRLISEAEKSLMASRYPKKVCVSAISSTENPGSYLSFMSCGYSMISKFVSKEDGDTDYLLYKPLSLEHAIDIGESGSKFPSSKRIQDLDALDERHCIFRDANKTFHVRDMSLMSMKREGAGLSADML